MWAVCLVSFACVEQVEYCGHNSDIFAERSILLRWHHESECERKQSGCSLWSLKEPWVWVTTLWAGDTFALSRCHLIYCYCKDLTTYESQPLCMNRVQHPWALNRHWKIQKRGLGLNHLSSLIPCFCFRSCRNVRDILVSSIYQEPTQTNWLSQPVFGNYRCGKCARCSNTFDTKTFNPCSGKK